MSLTPATARRYSIIGPQKGILERVEIGPPGPGEALIRVRVNGVCASEIEPWSRGNTSAVPLGHEAVGTVSETGVGVDLAEGTWVTGRILASFADFAIADARDLVVVPPQLDPVEVLGEPLGCVVDAFERTPISVGDHVAVVGLGFMGLLFVQLLATSPLATLTGIDPRPDARKAGLDNGLTRALAPDEGGDARAGGFDVVVEASGSQAGLDTATALVADKGAITILGYHQTERTVDMRTWNLKAIDVINGHVHDRDRLRESTRRGLEIAAHNQHVDTARLITHRFGLDDLDAAFLTLRSKPEGFIKAVVMIDPDVDPQSL